MALLQTRGGPFDRGQTARLYTMRETDAAPRCLRPLSASATLQAIPVADEWQMIQYRDNGETVLSNRITLVFPDL